MDPSSVPSKLVCTVRDKGEGPLLQHLGAAGTVSGPAVHQASSSTWGLQALSLDLPPSARLADLVKSQSDIYCGFPGNGVEEASREGAFTSAPRRFQNVRSSFSIV